MTHTGTVSAREGHDDTQTQDYYWDGGGVGGWPHKHHLSGMDQNSRVPEGKRMFSINNIVCTNSLDTRTALSGSSEDLLKSRYLDASQGPLCEPASLRRAYYLNPSAQKDLEIHYRLKKASLR